MHTRQHALPIRQARPSAPSRHWSAENAAQSAKPPASQAEFYCFMGMILFTLTAITILLLVDAFLISMFGQ
jgi:hypothetical protein